MSAIGVERAAMVAELVAAGIPATTHPGDVWAMAASGDVAALVGVPEEVQLTNLPLQLRVRVPVTLMSRGPDVDGYTRLEDALPAVLRVLRPVDPATQTRHQRGDASLPAYLIECLRSVEE